VGHFSKDCRDPITSWGIILVKLDGYTDMKIDHNPGTKIDKLTEVKMETTNDYKKASILTERLKFLLISRKHSLGYVEFVMGRYNLTNIDHLSFLIQQMMPHEIEKIKKNIDNFGALWEDLWGDKAYKGKLAQECTKSMNHFNKLNDNKSVDITLNFLLENIKTIPTYCKPEYGFPKGRKNRSENDRDCAVREFCEESGYTLDDIKIIDEIDPIIEEFNGTNGVRYRHIYYVAECITDKEPTLTGNENQKYEIGSVEFATYNDIKYMIREYHMERKNIITRLFFYYLQKLMVSKCILRTELENNTKQQKIALE
jgi:8-oxo-dGTP pyrophosphatase MutT (NUDIX family)